MNDIDQIDINILAVLEKNARISIKELSRRLGYPDSTIRDRIRSLEENGVIKGYHTVLDPQKLGLELKVVIHLTQTKFTAFEQLADDLQQYPEVLHVQFGTGEVDEMITLHARDIDHLKKVLYAIFGTVEWPTRTSTNIILYERNFSIMSNFIDK